VNEIKFEAAGVLGLGFIGALFATIRMEVNDAEHHLSLGRAGKPVIFVFWHSQMLPLVHLHRHRGDVVLVSEHADGEYITRVLHRNGFGTVRGSSTRGATRGLRGLIREARAGRNLALTPDGPRGPVREFKAGALAVAQTTGLPLIPIGVDASSAWRLASWDAFLVPKPFSKVRVAYGPPRWIPRDTDRASLDWMAGDLGRELDRLTALMGGTDKA
jgi:hypothetical protein